MVLVGAGRKGSSAAAEGDLDHLACAVLIGDPLRGFLSREVGGIQGPGHRIAVVIDAASRGCPERGNKRRIFGDGRKGGGRQAAKKLADIRRNGTNLALVCSSRR